MISQSTIPCRRTISAIFAILVLGEASAAAQPAPPAPPAPQGAVKPAPFQLVGSVANYNYGPRGNPEGFMLKMGEDLVQINFPPDAGETVAAAAAIADKVTVSATQAPAAPTADHPVYELLSLTLADGKVLNVAGPGARKPQRIEGTVKNLNYGRRGEINGVVLENGDFVNLGPEGAQLLDLAVGQKLVVEGHSRPWTNGHNAIEADSINGTRVRIAPPPPDHGPGGRGPGPADAPPRPRQ